MEIAFLMVCASVSLSVTFLIFFIWSVKDGQYEDCYTPSMRVLFEDKENFSVEKENMKEGDDGRGAF